MGVQTKPLARTARTSWALSGSVRFAAVYTRALIASMPCSSSNPEPQGDERNQKGNHSG